jgi:hypothetical protein
MTNLRTVGRRTGDDDEYVSGSLTPGKGITDAVGAYASSVTREGDLIKTTIFLDLTGLRSTASGDIIGDDGTSEACHIGRILAGKSGTIVAGRVTCLEAPTGGDPDIDIFSAVEGTGAEDAAITGLDETQLVDTGDHTLGSVDVLTAFPADGEYLYLVAGATTDADYTAGKLLIEMWGTAA